MTDGPTLPRNNDDLRACEKRKPEEFVAFVVTQRGSFIAQTILHGMTVT